MAFVTPAWSRFSSTNLKCSRFYTSNYSRKLPFSRITYWQSSIFCLKSNLVLLKSLPNWAMVLSYCSTKGPRVWVFSNVINSLSFSMKSGSSFRSLICNSSTRSSGFSNSIPCRLHFSIFNALHSSYYSRNRYYNF